VTRHEPLRLIPLGGLGEFGLNTMVFEHGGDRLVVDCGVMFPETAQLGVERVLPDLSYLFAAPQGLRGIVLTHGHEDHVGALPYLLHGAPAPVYGSRMTLGLVREKLREHGRGLDADLREVGPRRVEAIGPFQVEFLQVTHSIPDSLAVAVRTPAGIVVHTADFKMDQTPVDGRLLDYQRFSQYGDEGVLALLSDSTNAEQPGYTPSERSVWPRLDALFRSAEGRVVLSSFATNVHRLQQAIDLATRQRRLVCFAGRAMGLTTRVAEDLGLLRLPAGAVVEPREVGGLPPGRVLILAGGSQGEPDSALMRIALGDHPQIRLEAGDLVILSARAIPGNERAITRLVNHLTRRGARVAQHPDPPCHVSGHASGEELKMMLALTRPRFFVPVHGEYRQLAAHARLAAEMRLPAASIVLAENGDVIELTAEAATVAGKVEVGTVFLDGTAGEVEEVLIRDRRRLSGDGLLIPVVVIDRASGRLESPPEVVSRGFVWDDGEGRLQEEVAARVEETVRRCSAEERGDWGVIRSRVQEDLRRFLRKRTRRRPLILPIVIET
jgi:ribonuclease J